MQIKRLANVKAALLALVRVLPQCLMLRGSRAQSTRSAGLDVSLVCPPKLRCSIPSSQVHKVSLPRPPHLHCSNSNRCLILAWAGASHQSLVRRRLHRSTILFMAGSIRLPRRSLRCSRLTFNRLQYSGVSMVRDKRGSRGQIPDGTRRNLSPKGCRHRKPKTCQLKRRACPHPLCLRLPCWTTNVSLQTRQRRALLHPRRQPLPRRLRMHSGQIRRHSLQLNLHPQNNYLVIRGLQPRLRRLGGVKMHQLRPAHPSQRPTARLGARVCLLRLPALHRPRLR